MSPLDHLERVRRLAEQARKWEAQDDTPTAPQSPQRPKNVCSCATCGVVNLRLRAALMRRGWGRMDVHRVAVHGNDFAGAEMPYLASVTVDGAQVYRIMSDLAEALDEDIMADIEAALRRGN